VDSAAALALLFAGVLGAFLVDVAVFVGARRARPEARRGKAHAISAVAALVAAAIYFIAVRIPGAWIVPGLVMVFCNSYIGFHLDNMAETARRIRLLRELQAAPGLTREALLAAYPPQEVFELRIRRLKLAGQCVEENGRLRMTGDAYSLMGTLVALGRKVIFPRLQGGGGDKL
jgi:hypothetical protein